MHDKSMKRKCNNFLKICKIKLKLYKMQKFGIGLISTPNYFLWGNENEYFLSFL